MRVADLLPALGMLPSLKRWNAVGGSCVGGHWDLPAGGPIIGNLAQHAGPRWGLAVGGFAALIATSLAVHARRDLPTTSARTAPGAHDLPPGAGAS